MHHPDLPRELAVLTLYASGSVPILGPVLGSIPRACPREAINDGLWLVEAFRRATPVGPMYAEVLTHEGAVVGLAFRTTRVAVPHGLARRLATGSSVRAEPLMARVDLEGRILATSGPIAETPALRRTLAHLARRPGSRGVHDGHRIALTQLQGPDGVELIARFEPLRALRTPGFAGLTARQVDVCSQAASGLSAPEIARRRACSVETVRTHLRAVYKRLDITSRVELAQAMSAFDTWRDHLVPQVARHLVVAHA